jgi:hypothetical protein
MGGPAQAGGNLERLEERSRDCLSDGGVAVERGQDPLLERQDGRVGEHIQREGLLIL